MPRGRFGTKGTGEEHRQPVKAGGCAAQYWRYRRRMGTSCGQDERSRPGVTEPGKEIFRSHFGPNFRAKAGVRSGLNFALGKSDKTR